MTRYVLNTNEKKICHNYLLSLRTSLHFASIFLQLVNWSLSLKSAWMTKRATNTIPQSEILSVITVVQQVMICMMSGSVDNGLQNLGNSVISIVNRHRPNIDENEERQINVFIQREYEREQVVRNALQETVHRMKSVTCKWSWHLPSVMNLVQILVHGAMVQSAMDPVN